MLLKKFLNLFFAVLFLSFLAFNCTAPATTDNEENIKTQTNIVKIISNSPEMKMTMPSSLSSNVNKASSSILRSVNDVTDLVSDNLKDVKSSSWYMLQYYSDPKNFATLIFYKILKNKITESGIPDNGIIEFGNVSIPEFGYYPSPINLGKAKITDMGNQTVDIYWTMNYPLITYKDGNYVVSEYVLMRMYFKVQLVNDKYVIKMQMKTEPCAMYNNQPMGYYSSYNGQNGDVFCAEQVSGMVCLMQSKLNNDGSRTIMTKYDIGSIGSTIFNYKCEFIGWGDDTMGGVLELYENVDPSGDGRYSASTDFYNGDGSLVYDSYGNRTLDTSYYIEVEARSNNIKILPGISSAPDTIKIQTVNNYNSTPQTTSILFSLNGSVYTDVTSLWQSDRWEVIYKAGTDWVQGDAIYYYQDSTSDYIGKIYTYTTTYYKANEIPAAESIFGKNYYMTKYYPLKYVLPLSSDYSNYTLKQKEGETQNYTESDGYKWSWTSYEYWLENNAPTPPYTSNPNQYDNGYDIKVNGIYYNSVYSWNYTDNTFRTDKAPFIRVSNTLPPYLIFKAQSIKDGVTNKINAIYSADYSSFDIANYQDELNNFPVIGNFPVL